MPTMTIDGRGYRLIAQAATNMNVRWGIIWPPGDRALLARPPHDSEGHAVPDAQNAMDHHPGSRFQEPAAILAM